MKTFLICLSLACLFGLVIVFTLMPENPVNLPGGVKPKHRTPLKDGLVVILVCLGIVSSVSAVVVAVSERM